MSPTPNAVPVLRGFWRGLAIALGLTVRRRRPATAADVQRHVRAWRRRFAAERHPTDKSQTAEHSAAWHSALWERFDNWSGAWVRCTLADGRVGVAVRTRREQAELAAFERASHDPEAT